MLLAHCKSAVVESNCLVWFIETIVNNTKILSMKQLKSPLIEV